MTTRSAMRLLLVLSALIPLLGAAAVRAQDNYPVLVRAVGQSGQDGDATYYRVVCRDKAAFSIVVHDDDRVCVMSQPGQPICKNDWSINEAAGSLCK